MNDNEDAVCSNTGCFRRATVRVPRHLCDQCSVDPVKNGPMVLGDDVITMKKQRTTK